ncbi:agmatinase family protein [Microbacterium sp. PAMC22086]|uniref:agmatinase family protein n=1 Tax=Microbacterium sp. PAMC22086 TaxID=2861281 RepID=UPI001C63605B|nr:agmatinase family protein [Microbacterium sp. PAMC22086]QYG13156.1 agmatinase family protein [Microbacterium sp. PAMC22086]
MNQDLRVIQSGVATFFGRPMATIDSLGGARCAITGIPWDEGNAGRNGANMGPRAFRDASSWFFGYDAQRDFDLWEELPTVDVGDVPVMPPNAEATMSLIESHIRRICEQGVLPLSIGGNHSLAIGAARGAAATVGKMGYISIDAHLDTAYDWGGETLTSGCPTMRAAEIPNVDPENVVVFGIHGWLNPRDQVMSAAEQGIRWYGMEEIQRLGVERAIDEALARALDGVDGLYVSFDLDAVDASAFPGTGTPEPGGFTPRETFQIARALGRAKPIAMDLVEIAPIYDLSGISARLACGTAMEMLSGTIGH